MQRIRLDAAVFEGDSNAYLLGAGTGEPTLIDTGIATERAETELREALDETGLALADIAQVLLTHFHYDHAGLAGLIQAESGATVYAHPLDAELLAPGPEGIASYLGANKHRLGTWGVPESVQADIGSFLQESATFSGTSVDVTALADGETVDTGDRSIVARLLPGHTAGHLAFDWNGAHLFGGDLILPQYTANVGGDLRLEDPLGTYLESLDRVLDLAPTRIHPGHRDRIDAPEERIGAIIDHHRHRSGRILEHLGQDSVATPWEVATAMFGDLTGIHALHGVGEVAAHLTCLDAAGVIAAFDHGYRQIDSVESIPDRVPALEPRRKSR